MYLCPLLPLSPKFFSHERKHASTCELQRTAAILGSAEPHPLLLNKEASALIEVWNIVSKELVMRTDMFFVGSRGRDAGDLHRNNIIISVKIGAISLHDILDRRSPLKFPYNLYTLLFHQANIVHSHPSRSPQAYLDE